MCIQNGLVHMGDEFVLILGVGMDVQLEIPPERRQRVSASTFRPPQAAEHLAFQLHLPLYSPHAPYLHQTKLLLEMCNAASEMLLIIAQYSLS